MEKDRKLKLLVQCVCGMLTLLFLILNISGITAWYWVWILSPLWIPYGLGCLLSMLSMGLYLTGCILVFVDKD